MALILLHINPLKIDGDTEKSLPPEEEVFNFLKIVDRRPENGEQSESLCKVNNSLGASTFYSRGSDHGQRRHGHGLDGEGVALHGALHQLGQL